MLDVIKVLWAKSFVRWIVLSGFSFSYNLCFTFVLHELCHLKEELAYSITSVTLFFMNFFSLKYFVFKGSNSTSKKQFFKYTGAMISLRSVDYYLFYLLIKEIELHYLISIIITIFLMSILKYFFFKAIFKSI